MNKESSVFDGSNKSTTIREVSLEVAVDISKKIPEFHNPYGLAEYHKRLQQVPSLVLAAFYNGEPAGFKVGYEREGYFYSWMGGVLPKFRRQHIARQLAVVQEQWAKKQGYPHITFKTRNRLKPMLVFALKRGFNIIDFEKKETVGEHRIILRKEL